jgi:hypothetical protein
MKACQKLWRELTTNNFSPYTDFGCELDGRGIRVGFPSEKRDFSVPPRIETDSGAFRTSYLQRLEPQAEKSSPSTAEFLSLPGTVDD